MALLRKVVIVLVGVSLALLVSILLLNPSSIMQLALNLTDTSVFIRLPLAILIDAVVLAVIVLLVRSERLPRSTTGLMVKAQGAIADVSVDSARERILRTVREVPDVLSAEAAVKAVRGKADVDLDVVVARESTNLPEKQREIDRALRQVINKQLGLQMAGKPRVHIRMGDERLEVLPQALAPASLAPVEPLVKETVPASEPAREDPVEPVPAPPPDAMTLRGDSEPYPEASDTPPSE